MDALEPQTEHIQNELQLSHSPNSRLSVASDLWNSQIYYPTIKSRWIVTLYLSVLFIGSMPLARITIFNNFIIYLWVLLYARFLI